MSLIVDSDKCCYRVSFPMINAGQQTVYKVELRPNPHQLQFDVVSVRFNNNRPVTGDLKYHIATEAKRLVFTRLLEQLSPQKGTKLRAAERVRLSYYYTLMTELKKKARIILRPTDLAALYAATRHICWRIKELKIEARSTGHDLVDYFEDLRDQAIALAHKQYDFPDQVWDFYRSVLSRAFAWREGVPPEAIKLARTTMPD